jgi:gamma-glutamylcyclotransferase (GGCT)/AIG2-like uncharacterized protein YtfP
MKQYLFSYGTLQKEKVQLESFGRLLHGEKDSLLGYKLSLVKITDPVVLEKSGQQYHPIAIYTGDNQDLVEGMVFEVNDAELKQADEYEVADYRRVEGKLLSGKETWVYVEV